MTGLTTDAVVCAIEYEAGTEVIENAVGSKCDGCQPDCQKNCQE